MIIHLIEIQPARRVQPAGGDDASKDFNYWFDGGAAFVQTGCTKYHFLDGSIVRVPVLLDWKKHLWFKRLGRGP